MNEESQFSKDEIEKAKKNTFILLGNTGNGKSTIANFLCKSNAEVSQTKMSVTKEANCYYGKIDDNKTDDNNYFCIIDTPGFSDTEGNDHKNYENIKNYLIDSNYNIKGIYVICNFQDERFNDAEQKCVKAISDLFPLKNFWDFITIIFTHYYNKGLKSREDIIQSQEFQDSFKKIIEKLIQEVCERNCIDIISYEKINTLYVDIYNDKEENNFILNDLDDDEKEEYLRRTTNKKEENKRSYDELINDIKTKINQPPLYDTVTIILNDKAYLFEERNNKYDLYEGEIETRLFFLNNEMLAFDYRIKNNPRFIKTVNQMWHNFLNIIEIFKKDKNIGLIKSVLFYPKVILSNLKQFQSLNLKQLREYYLNEYDKQQLEQKENIF